MVVELDPEKHSPRWERTPPRERASRDHDPQARRQLRTVPPGELPVIVVDVSREAKWLPVVLGSQFGEREDGSGGSHLRNLAMNSWMAGLVADEAWAHDSSSSVASKPSLAAVRTDLLMSRTSCESIAA